MPEQIIGVAVKPCSRCKATKPLTEFRKKLDKLTSACKTCLKLAMHDYIYSRSDEKVIKQLANQRRYHEENKVERNQKCREWHAKNKGVAQESSKSWRHENKEYLLDYFAKYRKENIKKILRHNSTYCKAKRESDPEFAMKSRLRCLISSSIRKFGYSKRSKTQETLGCDWAYFKSHIESQFLDGMSWDNRAKWHIDHVVPLASANSCEEVIRLNHYTNLRPLWAKDNIRKGAKLDWAPDGSTQTEISSENDSRRACL